MKISCSIEQEHLALGFDDLRFIYIQGSSYAPSKTFFVKNEDFYGRDDMSAEEKKDALKAIGAYNQKNAWQIALVDD
jgi:hypothetical protein